jgi:hypothetical protein
MSRIIGLTLAILLAVIFLYISRFWIFDLLGREGLLGIEYLRPGGDILRRELRGTPLAPYDLLVWVAGGFFLLTMLEKLWGKVTNADH